jgi:hypothetical protein
MCIFIHKLAIAVRIKISKYPRKYYPGPETLYNLAASRRPWRYGNHACKKKKNLPKINKAFHGRIGREVVYFGASIVTCR